ncbi:MAG: hypothetical protein INR62_12280 [Rhodospirillales bacterium]|nr:hypothetical protein [Acetobacter sp.]
MSPLRRTLTLACLISVLSLGRALAQGDGTADARLDTASGRIKSPPPAAYTQAQHATAKKLPRKKRGM